MFDQFTADERLKGGKIKDTSIDTTSALMREEEQALLESRFRELEAERNRFTDATVKLGKEKAALEVSMDYARGKIKY